MCSVWPHWFKIKVTLLKVLFCISSISIQSQEGFWNNCVDAGNIASLCRSYGTAVWFRVKVSVPTTVEINGFAGAPQIWGVQPETWKWNSYYLWSLGMETPGLVISWEFGGTVKVAWSIEFFKYHLKFCHHNIEHWFRIISNNVFLPATIWSKSLNKIKCVILETIWKKFFAFVMTINSLRDSFDESLWLPDVL